MEVKNIISELATHPTKQAKTRRLDKVTHFVPHHSAVEGGNIYAHARYHVNFRQWPTVAYHFYISDLGEVMQCLGLETVGYHCGVLQGNYTSIAVCIEGDFDSDEPTGAQLDALVWLKLYIDELLGKRLEIKYHDEYKKTSCPGKNFPKKLVAKLERKHYTEKPKQDKEEAEGEKGGRLDPETPPAIPQPKKPIEQPKKQNQGCLAFLTKIFR